MLRAHYTSLLGLALLMACQSTTETDDPSTDENAPQDTFMWEGATVYFALTDRFLNGDPSNDEAFDRTKEGAPLRSYLGGDLRGVIQKLDEGYFTDLGVNALWLTPPYENIHGYTDEGTGKTYAFHGYWPRDWSAIDPNLGTMVDYQELVEKAHAQGIRVILDVIINHTGPVTAADSQWPDSWVRTEPACTWEDPKAVIECTLVENLPDIRTESEEDVELPEFLVEKWKAEGRYEQEVAELDEFFAATGYPRAPKYYIIKWMIDYVKELGIDGFRIDTAKHTEASVWGALYREAVKALETWRANHPEAPSAQWDEEFYMVGEVYGYSIGHGLYYPYNDTAKVNFYKEGFQAMINFDAKGAAHQTYETAFAAYSQVLHQGELEGLSTLNYLASHDDGGPYDKMREQPFRAANMLMLLPGAAQIYYGDESSRVLDATELGADGDAHLRTPMNWDMIASQDTVAGTAVQEVLAYYQKLGQFRAAHPAVGAGVHQLISEAPYTFSRKVEGAISDQVVVTISDDIDEISVAGVFTDGTKVRDYFTGQEVEVEDGKVILANYGPVVLLGED
ncbi:MAG: alpha-amylase family glycosyl hydrolase [Bacteroidota bacterium]